MLRRVVAPVIRRGLPLWRRLPLCRPLGRRGRGGATGLRLHGFGFAGSELSLGVAGTSLARGMASGSNARPRSSQPHQSQIPESALGRIGNASASRSPVAGRSGAGVAAFPGVVRQGCCEHQGESAWNPVTCALTFLKRRAYPRRLLSCASPRWPRRGPRRRRPSLHRRCRRRQWPALPQRSRRRNGRATHEAGFHGFGFSASASRLRLFGDDVV